MNDFAKVVEIQPSFTQYVFMKYFTFFFIALLFRHDSSLNLDEIFTTVEMSPVQITGERIDPRCVALLARLLHCEAGNQSQLGQLAVATVVLNRAQQRTDFRSLKQVIYAPGQFDGVHTHHFWARPSKVTMIIARECLGGLRAFKGNVLYFYNPRTSTDGAWIRKLSRHPKIIIGDHAFVWAPQV